MFIVRSTDVVTHDGKTIKVYEVCRQIGIKSKKIVGIVLVVEEEKLAKHVANALNAFEKNYGVREVKRFIFALRNPFFQGKPKRKKILKCFDLRYTVDVVAPPVAQNVDGLISGEHPLDDSDGTNTPRRLLN